LRLDTTALIDHIKAWKASQTERTTFNPKGSATSIRGIRLSKGILTCLYHLIERVSFIYGYVKVDTRFIDGLKRCVVLNTRDESGRLVPLITSPRSFVGQLGHPEAL
jgi:hypothetical protein